MPSNIHHWIWNEESGVIVCKKCGLRPSLTLGNDCEGTTPAQRRAERKEKARLYRVSRKEENRLYRLTPEYKEKARLRYSTPEYKEKARLRDLRRRSTPEHKEKERLRYRRRTALLFPDGRTHRVRKKRKKGKSKAIPDALLTPEQRTRRERRALLASMTTEERKEDKQIQTYIKNHSKKGKALRMRYKTSPAGRANTRKHKKKEKAKGAGERAVKHFFRSLAIPVGGISDKLNTNNNKEGAQND